MTIVPFSKPLYTAEEFRVETEIGLFRLSGTLCGHIDFVGPWKGTLCLSPEEAFLLGHALLAARKDVLQNSDPLHDPRLV